MFCASCDAVRYKRGRIPISCRATFQRGRSGMNTNIIFGMPTLSLFTLFAYEIFNPDGHF